MAAGYAEQMERDLRRLIVPLGFKEKYGVLWFDMSDGVRGFLGLPRATYGTSTVADFGVAVGVRFEPIYQLQVSLGTSPESKTGCNIRASMEYLAPKGQRWRFERGVDNSAAIERLLSDVSYYALPFYAMFCSPAAALAEYERGVPSFVSGWSSFLPVALFSVGQYDRAIQCARTFATNFDPKRNTGRVYHQFVQRLEQACKGSASGVGNANS